MLSKSLPAASRLFPSVLKLTSAPSLQVKTLVYLVTLRLAPSHPDEALLSINSFQRDLSDHSPLIRGMALRVLSGLAVTMAAPLMQMAIAKSVRDPSFYVRRIAADAIGKCYELSPSALPDLVPHLSTLLGDRHPAVLGSALLAYQSTVPAQYDLLHPHFRRICTALVDVDEWNQPTVLKILAAYARLNINAPTQEQASKVLDPKSEKIVPGRSKWGQDLDKDLELLLAKAEPLLSSRNPAVVLSTAHFYLSLLPLSSPFHTTLVQPILSLIRLHPSQSFIALLFIKRVHALRPDLFAANNRAFLPRSIVSGESPFITAEKVDLLVDLSISQASTDSVKFALSELQELVLHRSEPLVVGRAVKALGRLAMSRAVADADMMDKCTDVLLSALKEHKRQQQQRPDDSSTGPSATANLPSIAHQAMSVLSQLITARSDADPASLLVRGHMLYKLSHLLFKPDTSSSDAKLLLKSSVTDPKGRATIYWLLGQFCNSPIRVEDSSASTDAETTKSLASTILPDILRKSALHFCKESPEVKLAILTFSAKLVVTTAAGEGDNSATQAIATIHAHLLQLARYDASFDVRDRARYYKSLTSGVVDGKKEQDEEAQDDDVATAGVRLRREQVAMVLFGPQEEPSAAPEPSSSLSSSPSRTTTTKDAGYLLDPQVIIPSSSAFISHSHQHAFTLPQWQSDPSQLPPPSVRDASAPTAAAAAPSSVASLSSDFLTSGSVSATTGTSTSASKAPSPLTTRTSSPIPSAPAVTRQGKGKYRDLDAFLDESSSESEESSSSSSSGSEEESEEEDEEEEEDSEDESEGEEEEADEESEHDDDDAETRPMTTSIPRLSGEMTQNQWA